MQFQSTHPRRVRLCWTVWWRNWWCFNPRTHVGCDWLCRTCLSRRFGFNPRTHVGCDRKVRPILLSRWSFNPRTHVGCDTWIRTSGGGTLAFQSTHPRRVRLRRNQQDIYMGSFNPRTHVGCDNSHLFKAIRLRMFQSTHPRRVRLTEQASKHSRPQVSIHAPT